MNNLSYIEAITAGLDMDIWNAGSESLSNEAEVKPVEEDMMFESVPDISEDLF